MQKSNKFRIDFTKIWTACDSRPKELVHIPIAELLPIFKNLISG